MVEHDRQRFDPSTRPCILFDLDGTLLDTRDYIIATATQVLSERGMTAEEMGDVGRLVGPPFPAGFTIIYGMSEADAQATAERYRELFRARGATAYPLFPGVPEMLGNLACDGRRLAVTSSRMQALCERFLADDGVAERFEAIVGKRDPAHADKATLVAETLDALGVQPDEAVMVGDRFYDVEGAHAVGVPCVAVLFGTAPRRELEDAGAEAIVESVAELERVLRGA